MDFKALISLEIYFIANSKIIIYFIQTFFSVINNNNLNMYQNNTGFYNCLK